PGDHRDRAHRAGRSPGRALKSAVPVLLFAALLPAAGSAQDRHPECAKLADPAERLACYDELARPAQSSSSYLNDAWQLGPADGGVRHIADILTYRPNYILSRWTNRANTQPRS